MFYLYIAFLILVTSACAVLKAFYTRQELVDMSKKAGYKEINLTPMREMQLLRTGQAKPFKKDNSCWIEPFRANPS